MECLQAVSSVLVVRHGPERGRGRPYLQAAIDYLAGVDPALGARLRLHETGSPAPDLEGVGAVVFWLADPLRECYPECHRDACTIADAARERGLRLVNPPESLSNSVKSVQAGLWRAAGVPTPEHTRFEDRAELEAVLAACDYPAMVRGDLMHSQWMLHFCRSRREADAIPAERLAFPGTVSPFVDVREGYRAAGRDDVYARYYHKKRVFVFGDIVVPNHVFFSSGPIVGLDSSTFGRWAGWRRHLRAFRSRTEKSVDRACLEADYAFWCAPAEHPELMRRAARAIGQEFTAIDYSMTADGKPILWEANPYFALHTKRNGVLVRARRLAPRIRGFYDAMGRFFQRLLEGRLDDGP